MKRIAILAILTIFLLITALPAAAITKGEPDGEGHTNVGLMIAEIDGVVEWRCTGTLIAPSSIPDRRPLCRRWGYRGACLVRLRYDR
jgi:hypothetical protein